MAVYPDMNKDFMAGLPFLQVGAQRIRQGRLIQSHLHIPEDYAEHVVEVMGHSARQPVLVDSQPFVLDAPIFTGFVQNLQPSLNCADKAFRL